MLVLVDIQTEFLNDSYQEGWRELPFFDNVKHRSGKKSKPMQALGGSMHAKVMKAH